MTDNVVIREREDRAEAEFDWRTIDAVAPLVVRTVAEYTGTPRTELESLYEYVDPDALDALFWPVEGGRRTGAVEFHYEGHLVAVHGSGRIVVRPLGADEP